MKYVINQTVKVLETNQTKVISDYEYIEGIKLYYMTDNSAFPESQLQELSLEELIETNLPKLTTYLFDESKIEKIKNSVRNYLKNIESEEENRKMYKNGWKRYSELEQGQKFTEIEIKSNVIWVKIHQPLLLRIFVKLFLLK